MSAGNKCVCRVKTEQKTPKKQEVQTIFVRLATYRHSDQSTEQLGRSGKKLKHSLFGLENYNIRAAQHF